MVCGCFHVVRDVLARGRGMILVVGHLANWELIGVAVALEKREDDN